MSGEFELIRRHFAPLAAAAPGAFDLTDDAALLTPPAGCDLVLTADATIEGVHFLPDDPAGLVARKLLRVNLSDLAAMGAEPLGYLLTCAWPRDRAEHWIAGFAEGLRQDQEAYGLALLGGDTTATDGPLALSLTAVGSLAEGRGLRRGGAGAGDLLYVSGTLGDGALGLLERRGELPDLAPDAAADLAARYRLPQPRLALGQGLVEEGLATAAIDLSDGLLADVGHIAEASGLAARIEAAAVPLSPSVQAALADRPDLSDLPLNGGDDYELAFAVPPARAAEVATLAGRLGLPLTPIGLFAAGAGVQMHDAEGREVTPAARGWRHF